MSKEKQKSGWVSASDVGRTAFCPQSVALKHRGAKPSRQAIAARQRGEVRHEALNRQARQDKRCYVASYLYGVDDPRTQTLRDFRDQRLRQWPGGLVAIQVYYRLSPVVIRIARKLPWLDARLRSLVDRMACWCSTKDKF